LTKHDQEYDPPSLFKTFSKVYEENPRIRNSLVVMLLESILARYSGWKNAPIPD